MEVEIDYLAIGKRIRTARLSKKMTQETLSNMIDVAPTYVSSIENGHTKLSLATLLGIAQSLDTTVDQLLYDNTPVLVSKFDADLRAQKLNYFCTLLLYFCGLASLQSYLWNITLDISNAHHPNKAALPSGNYTFHQTN